MTKPSFAVGREDAAIIHDIIDRAAGFAASVGDRMDNDQRRYLTMDVTACHANGCPLKLRDLLGADDLDFVHDVFGIRNHINRSTGQLENCFLPRYASNQ